MQLPVEIEGEVRLFSVSNMMFEVYDYDPQNTMFFNNDQQICTMTEGWAEFVLAPPQLDGTIEFQAGEIDVSYVGSRLYFVAKIFNARKGVWETRIAEEKGPANETGPLKPTIKIGADDVNPFGHIVRLRIESREPPKKDPSTSNFQFDSAKVIEVQSIAARLDFKGAEPAPTPEPSTGTADASAQGR